MGVIVMLVLASQLFVVKHTATISRQPPEDQWYESSTSLVVTPSQQELFDCGEQETTECSLPTIVNYQEPLIEFSVSFDCSLTPFANEHSQKIFRKVASYKLDGRAVCCGVGIGVQYLHFPQNIKLLVLDGYCLGSLPGGTFGQFVKLERLQISASRINQLSSVGWRELRSLQELKLENNEFGTMERDSMDGLVQLQRLRVWNCTGVDFSIGMLEKLQVLELEQSMVKNISSIFNSIPSQLGIIHSTGVMSDEDPWIAVQPAVEEYSLLHKVTLVECFLTNAIVRDLPLVVSLNLSQNLLSENTVKLNNLPLLQQLILSHNTFHHMPASLLAIGPSLDTIDLSYNRLIYIQLDAFSMALSVSALDLSHNDLLNLGNFAPWPKLVQVQIDANPWDCRWLQHTRQTNPVLFDTFKYSQRFDTLSIRGLPCSLKNASIGGTTEPSLETEVLENIVTTIPPKGNPHGEIIKHGPKMTLKEPLNVSRPLVIVLTIAMGILISHVIILLYNRYRQLQHVPFYRHLSKDRTVYDTITEKSTSFMYEAPLNNDQDTAPLPHIYEEIYERETGVNYDVLNFHRFEMQYIDERDASNDPVYV